MFRDSCRAGHEERKIRMNTWKPREIIVHETVRDDPVTTFFIGQCPGVSVRFVESGSPKKIVQASQILNSLDGSMLDTVLAGKQVVFISPTTTAVDVFSMPDDRMVCPHFDRLKLASNGCFYSCDWCYLKLTYRAAYPFITVRAQYDKIKSQIRKRLDQSETSVMFNSGELADSLSMEHLTRAGREFIPWFATSGNGHLFMLTKSDNVDDILDLAHNGHTVLTWSMNDDRVSRKFEVGAPTFHRRLDAAYRVQHAGYPLRIRLDPIVPFDGWQAAYASTIKEIFSRISPERITLGTLRFEEGFYKMRNSFFSTGPELPAYLAQMEPMFPPKVFAGGKRPKAGKYSFREKERIEIFRFAIEEIRRYSDCLIALCKESESVWNHTGLPLSRCSCVCQLDYADMAR